MSGYPEYYTVVYRIDERTVILNDNSKPTPRKRRRLVPNNYYAVKETFSHVPVFEDIEQVNKFPFVFR